MNIFEKAIEVFSHMSDDLLISFSKLIKQSEIPKDGLVNQVIIDIYGERGAIYSQINKIMEPFADVLIDKLQFYSNQYNPNLI